MLISPKCLKWVSFMIGNALMRNVKYIKSNVGHGT